MLWLGVCMIVRAVYLWWYATHEYNLVSARNKHLCGEIIDINGKEHVCFPLEPEYTRKMKLIN